MAERLQHLSQGTKRFVSALGSAAVGWIEYSLLAPRIGPEAAQVLSIGTATSLHLLTIGWQNRNEAIVRNEEGWYEEAKSKASTSVAEWFAGGATTTFTITYGLTGGNIAASMGAAYITAICTNVPISILNENLLDSARHKRPYVGING